MTNNTKKISIVIPVYNEEKNIKSLYEELKFILNDFNKDYEIIFVNDASTDHSFDVLKSIFKNDNRVQVISLMGNQGQTMALRAGFETCSGDIVIAMDGDGQHDPKYIPQLVSAVDEGYDMVGGLKAKDSGRGWFSSALSRVAHRTIGSITGIKMGYFGATMKAYHRDLLEKLDLSGDLHRFMGALVYYKGIKVKEIPMEIRKRGEGSSSYSFHKIFRVALDLILIKFLTKYSKTPFRIFGSLGTVMSLFGFIGIAYVLVLKYTLGQSAAANISGLVVSSITLIVGIQFIFFGLMAEMISRIYYTSNNKKFFNVKDHLKH